MTAEPTRSAVLSDCGTYRYRLLRVWEPDRPRILWIMLNPSTADAAVDDPTIRRCMAFSRACGFGSMTVGNLYAYRATDPADLEAARARGVDAVGPKNNHHLIEMVHRADTVVAAWGARARATRAQAVADLVRTLLKELMCLGTTKGGHPRHPLYVRADQPLVPFTMEGAR